MVPERPCSLQLLTQEAGSDNDGISAPGQPHHTIGVLGCTDGEHVLHIFAFAAQGLRAERQWYQQGPSILANVLLPSVW